MLPLPWYSFSYILMWKVLGSPLYYSAPHWLTYVCVPTCTANAVCCVGVWERPMTVSRDTWCKRIVSIYFCSMEVLVWTALSVLARSYGHLKAGKVHSVVRRYDKMVNSWYGLYFWRSSLDIWIKVIVGKFVFCFSCISVAPYTKHHFRTWARQNMDFKEQQKTSILFVFSSRKRPVYLNWFHSQH